MPKKICIIKHCKNEITGMRLQRGYETCAVLNCANTHRLNKMTLYRAGKLGKETEICSVKNCGRRFVIVPTARGKCTKCRNGNKPQPGMPEGRTAPKQKPRSYYDRVSAGKTYNDLRSTICARDSVSCANYSRCTDTLFIDKKGGLFKYNTNGGVNCWEDPGLDIIDNLRARGSMMGCALAST